MFSNFQSFVMRKNYFNNDKDGVLFKAKSAERETPAKNPMTGVYVALALQDFFCYLAHN